MWLPVLFRFLVDSLATLGHRLAASGVTSRMLSAILLLFCSKMRSVSHPEQQNAIFWCRQWLGTYWPLKRAQKLPDARNGV